MICDLFIFGFVLDGFLLLYSSLFFEQVLIIYGSLVLYIQIQYIKNLANYKKKVQGSAAMNREHRTIHFRYSVIMLKL